MLDIKTAQINFKINLKQFFLYAQNGVILNLIGYIAYILLTHLGLNPLIVVTVNYPAGIILSFYFHKKFTYKQRKAEAELNRFSSYCAIYLLGYLLNITILYVFHINLLYPHEMVQLSSVIIIALILLFQNKKLVFNNF